MQILIVKKCGFSLNAAAPAAYAHLVALRFCKLLDTEAGSDTTSPKGPIVAAALLKENQCKLFLPSN
jgi:hypothetical protein